MAVNAGDSSAVHDERPCAARSTRQANFQRGPIAMLPSFRLAGRTGCFPCSLGPRRLWAIGLLLFVALQGCGRAVTINTNPPGARVQIFEVKNGVASPKPLAERNSPMTETLP